MPKNQILNGIAVSGVTTLKRAVPTLARRFYPPQGTPTREWLGSKDHQKQLRHLNYYRNYRRYGASATCVRRRVRSGNAPTLSPLPTRFYQCFWGYQMQPLVFFRQTLDIA